MKIKFNEKEIDIEDDTTLPELLKNLNYKNSVAIFVNGRQLLRSEYDHYHIQQEDSIKVVRILGGG